MAKFFIPEVIDTQEAERRYQATKKYAAESTGWAIGDRRIRSISYKDDDGEDVVANVGDRAKDNLEIIVAILESNSYLVCTRNRGYERGMPIIVATNEVTFSEDFEP